jgi:5'-deoxynucleotidase YfbR-like HD superfamily hydrolase
MATDGLSVSLRVMSALQRWGIVRCLQRQSVAEHSFYVAIYSDAVADLLGWEEPRRLHLLRAALWHDADEIVTGDIPGPVKRAIPQRHVWESYVGDVMEQHFDDYPRIWPDEKPVLIVANLLDECAYLAGEIRSGNGHVRLAYQLSTERLQQSWRELNLPPALLAQFLTDHLKGNTPLPT